MTDQQQDSLSEGRQRRSAVTLSVLLVYQAVFVFAVAFLPSLPSSLPDVAGKFIAAGMLTLVLPTYFLLPLVCVAVALRLHASGSRIFVLIGIQVLLSIGMTFVLLPTC